jgi:hypothetical protein
VYTAAAIENLENPEFLVFPGVPGDISRISGFSRETFSGFPENHSPFSEISGLEFQGISGNRPTFSTNVYYYVVQPATRCA